MPLHRMTPGLTVPLPRSSPTRPNAGVSTGASLAVAVRVCGRLPEGSSIVALSPDGGWKYLSTGAYAQDNVEEIAEQISSTLWA